MVLTNYKTSRIVSALESYEAWFKHLVLSDHDRSLSALIDTGQAKVRELSERGAALSFKRICMVKKGTYSVSANGYSHEYPYANLRLVEASYGQQYAVTDEQIREMHSVLRDVLWPGDIPSRIVRTHLTTHDFMIGLGPGVPSPSQRPDLIPHGEVERALRNTLGCTAETEWHPDAQSLSEQLERTGFSLVSLGALFLAARESLEAVRRFKADV